MSNPFPVLCSCVAGSGLGEDEPDCSYRSNLPLQRDSGANQAEGPVPAGDWLTVAPVGYDDVVVPLHLDAGEDLLGPAV